MLTTQQKRVHLLKLEGKQGGGRKEEEGKTGTVYSRAKCNHLVDIVINGTSE